MKLFVDDERPEPDGWELAKTSAHAIEYLDWAKRHAEPITRLSLDHDLSTVMYEDDTTRPVMLWMCENEFWPNELYIHTANPYGEEWLVGMARRYAPPGTLKGYGMNFWNTCRYDGGSEQNWEQ